MRGDQRSHGVTEVLPSARLESKLEELNTNLAIIAEELRRANRIAAWSIASVTDVSTDFPREAQEILDWAKDGR